MGTADLAAFVVDRRTTTDVVLHLSNTIGVFPAMDELAQLSDLQLSVMRALWRHGEATVSQVQADLEVERPLAATTVATLLSRLEKRGLARHRSVGRQYLYAATVREGEVRSSMVSRITDLFFGGDPTALLQHLIGAQDIAPGDLTEVQRLIRSSKSGRSEDDHD